MKIEHTARGFQIIKFKDHYGSECSLQQSSLAIYEQPGTSAIWLGVGDQRMHLTDLQLNELMLHLKAWIDTGLFNLE